MTGGVQYQNQAPDDYRGFRASAHLQEMPWRFNNRKNQYLFRDTLMRLLASDNLEYKELTKAA
jgi:hypothetical protein